jgi:O-antigen ligase
MTTSISSGENNALLTDDSARGLAVSEGLRPRTPHTLASRFLVLAVCVAIVASALAFGTVHYWAQALFCLGAVLIVVLWLVDGIRLGVLRVSRNALQLPLLGLLILGGVQLLPLRGSSGTGLLAVEVVRTLSLDPYATRLVMVQLTALLIYFAATLVFTDTPHRLKILVRTITIFGFLLAMFGLTQSFTSPTRVYWIRELPQSTAFGPFINRHHFAGYMELTLAIPLGLALSGGVASEKRFAYFFAAGMMAVALIMTNSRGGIISLVVEILFLVAFAGFRKRRRARDPEDKRRRVRNAALRAALALVLIVGMFGGVVLLGGEAVLSRFVGTVAADDPTTGRAHFWSVTLDIVKAHPLIGTGLGAFGVVYTRYDTRNGLLRLEQAHNDYLQILSDGGIVGGALGLFFVIALFRLGFIERESRDEFRRGVSTGALAGCFAVLVHSFFDFTLHTTANALLFLLLAALATLDERVTHTKGRRRSRRRAVSEADMPTPISAPELKEIGSL